MLKYAKTLSSITDRAAEYIANPEKPNIYGTLTFEDGSTL